MQHPIYKIPKNRSQAKWDTLYLEVTIRSFFCNCILTLNVVYFRARKHDIRQRTIAEVNLLYKLSHPHILSLIAAYQSPTHLVREILSFENL